MKHGQVHSYRLARASHRFGELGKAGDLPFQAKPFSRTITLSSLPFHSRTNIAPALRSAPSRVVGMRASNRPLSGELGVWPFGCLAEARRLEPRTHCQMDNPTGPADPEPVRRPAQGGAGGGMSETRKLAAILAADVVGYSRMMGEDEAGTARAVRDHRQAAAPIVRGFGGRLVKTMGDGVLLEFPSVVAAVECAIAIQQQMAGRNAGIPEARRILYRIGVNLGDVLLLEREAGKPVQKLRDLSLEAFRAEMAKSNDPGRRIVVNFTRAPLFGRGHGHFSPVLGYLLAEDLVFVGDVNANYRPWLVSTARLFDAQNTINSSSHAKRGVLEVEAR